MELVSFGLREREKEGEKEMIKERRKTAKGEAEREGGREGWMERNGEGGSREQASALHVLKGQMVTAGN